MTSRRRHPILVALLAAVALAPATRSAAPGEVPVAAPLAFIPPDAQGASMGEAFTALARGPEAAWWNPAALALGRGLWAIPYSRSDRWLCWENARLEHAAAAWSGGGLGIGAAWSMYEAPATIPIAWSPQTPWAERLGWRRQTATAALGIDLSRLAVTLPRAARIALGAAGRGYRDEVPGSRSGRHEGWDMDGAAILTWRLAEPSRPDEEEGAPGITGDLSLGYVAMNALDRDGSTETGSLPLGRRDRAGVALSLRIPVHWPVIRWVGVAGAFERRGWFLRAGQEDPAVDHVGGEISLGGIMAVRAGQVRDPLREGPGAAERRFTWGGGLALPPGSTRAHLPGLAVDYADLGNRSGDGQTAKQVTASIRFR